MSEGRVQFRNHEDVRSLFGIRDKNLRRLRDALHIDVVLRGDELHLHGDQSQVDLGTEQPARVVFAKTRRLHKRHALVIGRIRDEIGARLESGHGRGSGRSGCDSPSC